MAIQYVARVSRGLRQVWRSPGISTNWDNNVGLKRPTAGLLKAADVALTLVHPEGRVLEQMRMQLLGCDSLSTKELIALEDNYGAHNYHPLDVVLERGRGVWLWDVEGKKYLDCLSGYSALNLGHSHPRVIEALKKQAEELTLTSRAFRNKQLPLLEKELCNLTGYEMMLPMNSGAEAVETAVKNARKWGYQVKNIPQGKAEIITCANNFHGRTTTVISFSTEDYYRQDFGPFTPGFTTVAFGDLRELEAAITPNTAAFLFEPIQAEAGILLPPDGYLEKARELCKKHNVLFIADEIQTGLGRTGRLFACDRYGVKPDILIIGKSLGGGAMPISAVLSSKKELGLFKPGQHGSTFGGNPLACAVARASLKALVEEGMVGNAEVMGRYFMEKLRTLNSKYIKEVRGPGLLIGVELYPEAGGARKYCEVLMAAGLLCKETHDNVIRFAPPLIISLKELDWAFEQIKKVFAQLESVN